MRCSLFTGSRRISGTSCSSFVIISVELQFSLFAWFGGFQEDFIFLFSVTMKGSFSAGSWGGGSRGFRTFYSSSVFSVTLQCFHPCNVWSFAGTFCLSIFVFLVTLQCSLFAGSGMFQGLFASFQFYFQIRCIVPSAANLHLFLISSFSRSGEFQVGFSFSSVVCSVKVQFCSQATGGTVHR